MPTIRDVRPRWALTTGQVGALLDALPPLLKTMVGLAMLSGLRRGDLFALRWSDVAERLQCLSIRSGLRGTFSTPNTAARVRQVPLPDAAFQLLADWKARAKRTEPEALAFATHPGKPIDPKNVLQQWIVMACDKLALKRVSWLTLRHTYSSWAHAKGVPRKVIARLMGHAKVDTTLNVYTQVIDGSVAPCRGNRWIGIVHNCSQAGGVSGTDSFRR